LVTGGAGFIGSHLTERLLEMGAAVTVYDNFDDFYPGKEGNLTGPLGSDGFKVVRGSILDLDSMRKAMAGAQLVFRLAAQAGVRYGLAHPEKAHQVNVSGTLNVLNLARELKVQRLVYASSSSVYGNPTKVPISEEHPLNPTNIYGVSKLAAEKYCLAYHSSFGLPVTCLRYFSVYGPRGRPDQVLYEMASRVAAGNPPEIFGDGSQSRDFTFVSDIVEGTVLASLRDDSIGEVFNLGYGAEFSMNEAAARISEYFESKLAPVHRPAYGGDFSRTLCDNRKARTMLGWAPQVSFSKGLNEFLDWYAEKNTKKAGRP
jgi:nucleoside-diphosphate-sugar epimerase